MSEGHDIEHQQNCDLSQGCRTGGHNDRQRGKIVDRRQRDAETGDSRGRQRRPLSNCWAGVLNCVGRKPRRPQTAKITATQSVRRPIRI